MGAELIAGSIIVGLLLGTVVIVAALRQTGRGKGISAIAVEGRPGSAGVAAQAGDATVRREALLNEREERLNRLESELESRRDAIVFSEAELQHREAAVGDAEFARTQALSRVAGLSPEEARAELLAQAREDARLAAAHLRHDIEAAARAAADLLARRVIVTTIQRVAAEQTNESAVSVVMLPSDDVKGRLIGKEGRNIRAFEQITGANLLIDDTPATVLLSCFDPLRREIARLTLTELIADGRVHPGRIESVHARNSARAEQLCLRAAEAAVREMGITDLDPALLPILGSLQYRTSYGQNVLAHLVECGHLAATMAAELGLNVAICRRAAFLHDLGKAVTEETGSHAIVGAELARRHGEHADIVHAIEAHHNEVEPVTVEAILTQAADAISGSRPGARRESVELYIKRLDQLERLAGGHRGVEKVFAMQAGHEVRVMVAPEQVSDAESVALAQEIAGQVEAELSYPGNIKVTVVRESRATAVAR